MPGPTWAVSPSMVCLPVNTMSTACSRASWRTPAARAYEVASVSAPAKARSVTSTASSAPKLMHLRSASSACGGPMHSMVTLPPNLSFSRRASSSENRSYGLTMAGTPWRMMVLVTGWTRICAESGTCLIQTTMCMACLSLGLCGGARGHGCAQPVQRDMLRALGVLKHLEHLLLRRRRVHEVGIGLGQQIPVHREQLHLVAGGRGGLLPDVLEKALQDVQAAHVDHLLVKGHAEEFKKVL